MIRVALDITPEIAGSTGVARYSRELRRALERRPDCQVFSFAVGRGSEPLPDGARHLPVPLRLVQRGWSAFGLPRAEQLAGATDLVHSLDLAPPPTRLPLAVTVHDLVTRELPDMHGARAARMQRLQLAALERASAILAVSASTAQALLDAGLDPERIHVTAHGLTRLPPAEGEPVCAGRYVLVVGTLEPRKGHEVLLRACALGFPEEAEIVFAGPAAGREHSLRSLARELGLDARLHILGRVADDVLARLYRDAALLCLPSFGEGFGLPVLEAMAAGVPVVASELPAIREVAGDAAVLVPAGDVDALSTQVTRTLRDEALRSRLIERGHARAAAFSWERTAEATVRAYRSALGGGERDRAARRPAGALIH